ncbi:MAG: fibronectin-binding protein (FBP) [Gammaproteobacteria bacterium]|nr:fibronectin-binding protein (FBP) [Gammaproteobacteria bacterium]
MTSATPDGDGQPSKHLVRAGAHIMCSDDEPEPSKHRRHVEPWLSALLQAEHLNLLIGSGFTTAVAKAASGPAVDLSPLCFQASHADAIQAAASSSAERIGRGSANFEDQVRSMMELNAGLRVLVAGADTAVVAQERRKWAAALLDEWSTELDKSLSTFLKNILSTERHVHAALTGEHAHPEHLRRMVAGFLLPFSSRVASRERTHVFTTNYDRLVEYASDLLGVRIIDRFVGSLAPVFQSSRLGIDLHYNPPGIRGEPRYLEGVVHLTKLHGSVDWRSTDGPSGRREVQRALLPFGAADDHPSLPTSPSDQLLIYPNAAKDVETLEFPYAELFRDFSAAVCQPNAVILTYGYGFGDDHINRVLRDMLSIPSTHMVIISYHSDCRLRAFLNTAGRDAQVTLLVGPHFGDLNTLVENYLPKPAIDRTTWRMIDLLNRRTPPAASRRDPAPQADDKPMEDSE